MGLIIRGVHSSSRRHTRSDIACDQIADTPILSTDLNDWDLHPVTPFFPFVWEDLRRRRSDHSHVDG